MKFLVELDGYDFWRHGDDEDDVASFIQEHLRKRYDVISVKPYRDSDESI